MKQNWKKIAAFLLTLVMLASMVACAEKTTSNSTPNVTTQPADSDENASNSSDSGEEFRIGLSSSFTGSTAQEGLEAKNAAEMALSYINDNGGFNGVPGVLATTYDNKGSPEEAVKSAQKLIQNENVNAVIGSNSSAEVLSSGQFFNEAGIFTVGMGTSATWMKQGWKYVIRCSVNYDFVADELVKMVNDMGISQVAIMKD